MRRLGDLVLVVLQTLLRVLPFPRETGLIEVGNPGRDAPVFLTGNYRLTVGRVLRALEGVDAYLLVANSHGINVWCAAAGGHLTTHDVISVLKTSGVEARVDHRRVILPQLAATGVEGPVVRDKTGWTVVWGPVYATSIPEFLSRGMKKAKGMRTVRFEWPQRLEMAVAWAFPISLLALAVLPFWKGGFLPLAGFVWIAAGVIFLGFPLYEARLRTTGKSAGFVFFDFGERGLPLVLWTLFMLGLVVYVLLTGGFSWPFLLRWGVGSFVLLLILSLDLMGSTPTYKSGLHEDRRLRIELDEARCEGAGFCEQVCPTGVFVIDHDRRLALLPGADRCVQCGACIVQCPFDALHFRAAEGEIVTPETIRTFKLNLLGERTRGARR